MICPGSPGRPVGFLLDHAHCIFGLIFLQLLRKREQFSYSENIIFQSVFMQYYSLRCYYVVPILKIVSNIFFRKLQVYKNVSPYMYVIIIII